MKVPFDYHLSDKDLKFKDQKKKINIKDIKQNEKLKIILYIIKDRKRFLKKEINKHLNNNDFKIRLSELELIQKFIDDECEK